LKIRRLLLGLLLIALAAFFLLGEHLAEGSKSAVLNARKVTVRTPIEGILETEHRTVHQGITRNEVLGVTLDPSPDDRYLHQLQTRREFLEADHEELFRERANLQRQREFLLQRQAGFLALKAKHLREGQDVRVAQEAQAAALLQLRVAERQRAENLAAHGAETSLRLETAQAEEEAARQQLAQRQAEVARIQTEREAVAAGFNLDPGRADLGGSAAEIFQIEKRLAALDSEERGLLRRIASLDRELETARRSVRRDARFDLISPVDGQLWRILADDGERVQPGDPIFELVDCSEMFVTLTVRRAVYQRLEIGDPARFALDGGPTLEGRVSRLSGLESSLHRTELVSPIPGRAEDRYTVALDLPALSKHPALTCAVGKSGRVYFERRPLDFLRQRFPS